MPDNSIHTDYGGKAMNHFVEYVGGEGFRGQRISQIELKSLQNARARAQITESPTCASTFFIYCLKLK